MSRDIATTFAEWRFLLLTLLPVFSLLPDPWQWYRTIELLTLAPVLAVVTAGMTCFSLVTLATVGCGDVLPITHAARTLAMFEAVVGVFCVAVVVALFVGTYSSQRRA